MTNLQRSRISLNIGRLEGITEALNLVDIFDTKKLQTFLVTIAQELKEDCLSEETLPVVEPTPPIVISPMTPVPGFASDIDATIKLDTEIKDGSKSTPFVQDPEQEKEGFFCENERCPDQGERFPMRDRIMRGHKMYCSRSCGQTAYMRGYYKNSKLKKIDHEDAPTEERKGREMVGTPVPNFGSGNALSKEHNMIIEYAYCANPKCVRGHGGKYVKKTGYHSDLKNMDFCSTRCDLEYIPTFSGN